jgi:hypothetical protein
MALSYALGMACNALGWGIAVVAIAACNVE